MNLDCMATSHFLLSAGAGAFLAWTLPAFPVSLPSPFALSPRLPPPLSLAFSIQPTERTTPEAAVEAVRKALEANDLVALSQVTAGPLATTLRTLGEPLAKAQAAGARLQAALKDQPNLNFTNPFAAALAPFDGLTMELVEVGKEGGQAVARVKVGQKGSVLREETLSLAGEGGAARLGLPSDLAKALQRLQTEPSELKKQTERLEGLATVLGKLAEEAEKKLHKSRESLLLRLAQLVEEAKLAEEPKGKDKGTPEA